MARLARIVIPDLPHHVTQRGNRRGEIGGHDTYPQVGDCGNFSHGKLARAVVVGLPHHITQRGNRREAIFFEDGDQEIHRDLLAQQTRKAGVAMWAYCVMPNHVHLILTPERADGLGLVVGETHRRYTNFINARGRWTRHLFQSRFSSVAMDEQHMLAKTMAVVLLKRFVGLLCLTLLPLGSLAQTVAIRNLSIAKEPHQGARSIGVEVSLLNETNTAITLNNELFYLADPHDVIYRSLSRVDNAPVTFSDPLNPGTKISQHLWFEVPADVDYNTLRLCLHAADSKNWDDYVEIPLYSPEATTAPMLHPGVATEPTSAMSYARIMKDLVPPKLLFAVDPKLPRGGNEMLKKSSGKITSTVSLVVDRQGAPRQIFLVKSGGSDFDREAIRAVSRYRFKPATDQAHNPVAVRVNIEVTFRSY